MKKIFFLFLSMCILFLAGCNSMTSPQQESNGEDSVVHKKRDENTIVLWSSYPWDNAIKEFNKKYPNIKVVQEIIPFNDYVQKYMDALVSGDVPDVMVIDSNDYGNFNSIDGLEDLYNDKYNLKDYLKDYDMTMLQVGQSLDQKRLLGLPFASAPFVTYYRADIMKENGFPDDPKELSEYMKDPEKWIGIAEKLQKKGQYIVQWAAEPVAIYNRAFPSFDQDLKYIRDNKEFKEAVEISREMRLKGLVPYKDIWSAAGQDDLREGKFAMLYLGSWGTDQIESWAPEQKGKWRVTTLPFGQYGWTNSSILSIPTQSPNKDKAWQFIEYCVFKSENDKMLGSVKGYKPLRKDKEMMEYRSEFLGGQKEQAFFIEAMEKAKEHTVTSLDQKAYDIFWNTVNNGLEASKSTDDIMKEALIQIETQLSTDKDIILQSRKD